MRTILLSLILALMGAVPALAGDPETCIYNDRALAAACRNNPDIQAFLMEPGNLTVESYQQVPPVLRGWMPGEEEAVIGIIRNQEAGCGYTDPILASACMFDPRVKTALETRSRGPDTSWFALPPDVGGYARGNTDPRVPKIYASAASERLKTQWMFDGASNADRMRVVQGAIRRATGVEVEFARAYLIAVDERNFIACGYGFYNQGGDITSGLFVFDTRGGSALRAPQNLFNIKCAYADVVLR